MPVNRPPRGDTHLLTALCRSRPAGPFSAHDRASETTPSRTPAFSESRSATATRSSPMRRTPRTLALSWRSPARRLAGHPLTAPPERVESLLVGVAQQGITEYETQCALEYLLSPAEVDPKRIGCTLAH